MNLSLPRAAGPALLIGLCWWLAACQPTPLSGNELSAAEVADPDAQATDDETARLDRLEYPALQVTTLDGSQYDLHEWRGHWVLVNFWATWCAPCLKEMPELSALHTLHGHIKVIGLLAYDDITHDDLRTFLDGHPVSYPIAVIDADKPLADFATLRGLPPLRPFSRAAMALAGLRTAPPRAPNCCAIQLCVPNTPCNKAGR